MLSNIKNVEQFRALNNNKQITFNKKTNLEIPNDDFVKNNTEINDKSNNGKFDISECAKNFAKGVLSPLTAIVEHPLATISVVGVTAVACTLVPVLGPVTAIGFGALSAAQLGKGIYSAVKNYKNGDFDNAEKSFKDIGQGSVGTAMSFLGVKQGAKVAKEAKLMSELKVNSLSLEQKAKIAAEVDNAGRLNAIKEMCSLFTSKAGLKAVASQFKPSNIAQRGKDALNTIQGLRKFEKTPEGRRRAALSGEEIEQEITKLHKEVFDEYQIPEELRPKIEIVQDKIHKGGGYYSETHTIRINENAYRKGVFDLPNVLKHEATHAKKSLVCASLPKETREQLLQEYLISKINNGDNNTVIYEGGFIGNSTMKPPKLNQQMKTDFTNFVKNKIYGKNTNYSAEELSNMVRPFVESNKEFCAAYNSTDDAVKAMAQYAQSHQLRYNGYNGVIGAKVDSNVIGKYMNNIDINEAKITYLDNIECLDGNLSNSTTGQFLGFGGGDFEQYQFGAEEVLAQQKGNTFEIKKLQTELDNLRSTANYDKSREAYLLNEIDIARGTIRYKTLGREYYNLLQQLKNDPGNKELAAKVSSMKQELAYLQKRINVKMVSSGSNNIEIITPYNPGTTKDIPLNSGVAADIIADEIEKK